LYRFPKPVICALNGSANGGGLGLALMCDIRITHANAKFALGEINNGFFSYAQILAAHCINGGVRKLVYSGERISAAEAMQIGLVDEIVEKDMVYARALEIANDIANKPDGAVRIAKKAFIMADEQSLLRKKREDKMVYDLWAVKGMK